MIEKLESRNEEIDRKLNHPTTTTTAMSGSAAANSSYQTSSSSSRIASSSAQSSTAKYISTHHHHKIDTGTSSCDKGVGGDPTNDEDVLHVVTNVYTIPIVKSSGGDSSQQQQQEIHISTSTDDDFIRSSGLNNSSNRRCRERHEHVYGISGEGGEEMGEQDYIICSPPSHLEIKKTCRETRKITKRVIEEPCSTSNTAGDLTKSKFQIRSIVEIYENPLEAESTSICAASSTTNNSADQSTGFFKTSTQFNEFTTKETFTEPLISSSQRGLNIKHIIFAVDYYTYYFVTVISCFISHAIIPLHTLLNSSLLLKIIKPLISAIQIYDLIFSLD